MNNVLLVCLAFFVSVLHCSAQSCNRIIRGNVTDVGSGFPLPYANVIIQETSDGVATDYEGNFLFTNLCAGEYHLLFSHIGCEPKQVHIRLSEDMKLNVTMKHNITSLEDVVVTGQKKSYNNQSNIAISRQAIEDNVNKNLSGMLEQETGIYLLKSGSGISKPVVHGMYGNRLIILNHGVQQSGQQWGNDHAPEIDPYSADEITVLKGANAIEYGGGNLGSVILTKPKPIGRNTHLHGQVGYTFETNGRGNVINARLQKYSPILAWRIDGTLKKYGDKRAPDYFLRNTGIEEANLSVQLEKSWQDKLFLEVYASTFNTRLGILRGSHIGNITDLKQALTRGTPYYTEPNFSYAIEAPKQHVSHHLIKTKAEYFPDDNQTVELTLANQFNIRKEFDVRRGGRTNVPALSLDQYTFNAELKYTTHFGDQWKLKTGFQTIFTDNTNDPATGILPLVPDYISWKGGLFTTVSKQHKKLNINLGIRYDYEYQDVATISRSLPREVVKFQNNFNNIGGVVALKYDITHVQSLMFNVGYATRNPAINELYSNGLHQGVSGIEEGDINLKMERAIKSTLEYQWNPSTNFSLNTLIYYQYFNDYIFLSPQEAIRLTIRGAFPVFRYEQADAAIYGLDIDAQFTISNALFGQLRYSYIKGDNLESNIPLVFIPPNRLFGSLTYRWNRSVQLSPKLKLEELEFELNNRLVFEQTNLLPEQDFVAPPPLYDLVGAKVSTNVVFPNYQFRFFTKVDNMFNVSYRDYMNRQRYFADEPGISVIIGLSFKFKQRQSN